MLIIKIIHFFNMLYWKIIHYFNIKRIVLHLSRKVDTKSCTYNHQSPITNKTIFFHMVLLDFPNYSLVTYF